MVGIKINKTLRNVIIAIAAIIVIFAISSLIPNKDFSEKYEGFDLSSTVSTITATQTYSEYQSKHKKAAYPSSSVAVDVLNCDESISSGIRVESDYYGKAVVITEDDSSVTWSVDVPQEGFYNISMEYVAIPSRNVNMERALYINGEIPLLFF